MYVVHIKFIALLKIYFVYKNILLFTTYYENDYLTHIFTTDFI